MPTLTRWYIKSGLVYLILAVIMGASIKTSFSESSYFSKLTPVYYHFFMVGWVTQLIFGISFWMFPRYTREKPRGNETLAWITFALINIGLLLRAISEPMSMSSPSVFWGIMMVVSGILQWLAAFGYVVHIWYRIK